MVGLINYRNSSANIGDMIKFKDVRMDGTVRSEHVGIIYDIVEGYARLQWIDNLKPYGYVEDVGYSITKIQYEYDVFTILAKVEDVE